MVYLDNFLETELAHINDLAFSERPSEWLSAWEQACSEWGAISAQDKRVERAVVHTSLGTRVDGKEGIGSTPPEFDAKLISATWAALGEQEIDSKLLQVLAGRWVRKIQFKRDNMCCMQDIWRFIHDLDNHENKKGQWSSSVHTELCLLLCLHPLIVLDMRAPLSPLVTVSGASSYGCGVCRSTVVTPLGAQAIEEMNIRPINSLNQRIGLVSLYDGIGGARRAFELLSCEVGAYVSCEISMECSRVVHHAWPEVINWPKVEDITETTVNELRLRAPTVLHWFLIAGFPCQSFSRMNTERNNLADERGQLVHHIPRVESLLARAMPDFSATFVSYGHNARQHAPQHAEIVIFVFYRKHTHTHTCGMDHTTCHYEN